MRLKGGATTQDPRLDRVRQFDARSRTFPIRELLPEGLRGRSWPLAVRLDQGREGACVGFGWAHELTARPKVAKSIDNTFARERIYWPAQQIDPWPGGSYPGASPRYEGTSVLAGAKVVQRAGYMAEYRWAFGIDDVLGALAHEGPVVLGTDWTEPMFRPRPSGLLEPVRARVMGGHCWVARGLILKPRLAGEPRTLGPVVRATNSWGDDWGARGEFYIRVEDLEYLLNAQGEACVPIGRTLPTA